jgi:hypothetical protein
VRFTPRLARQLPGRVSHPGQRRSDLDLALVWIHALEVGEHHVAIQNVSMLTPSVVDHGVSNGVRLVPDRVASAARAWLLVGHAPHGRRRSAAPNVPSVTGSIG